MSDKVDSTIDYVLSKREDAAKLVFKYVYPNHPEKADEPTRRWEYTCRLQDLGWVWEGGTWVPSTDPKPDAEDVKIKQETLLSKRELAAQDVYHENSLKFSLPNAPYRYTEALRENGWRYNGEWIAPGMETKAEYLIDQGLVWDGEKWQAPPEKPSAVQQEPDMRAKARALREVIEEVRRLKNESARHVLEQLNLEPGPGFVGDMKYAEALAFMGWVYNHDGNWFRPIEENVSEGTHASDCAVHNEPAMPAGDCDCGASGKKDMRYEAVHALREAGWVWTGEKWQAPPKAPSRTPAQLAAVKTLERLRYEYTGDELWKPPVNNAYAGGHLGEMAAVPVLLGLGYTWFNDEWQKPATPEATQSERVDVNTLKGGEVFFTKDYGEVRFIGWDDYFGERTAVIESLTYGGRHNPKPQQLQAAIDAHALCQPLPQPKRDATGAFYGLSDEQVADVVQELVDGVRRGEVKVESLCVRFDMDDRNKRVIHIEYTACKT
jgi:hypothetical protein